MKKWLCGLLVLVMLVLTCSVGFGETETVTEKEVETEVEEVMDEVETEEAADGESDDDGYEVTEFSPDLMNQFDATASEWYQDKDYRALLTILCACDLDNTDGIDFDATAALVKTSYVIKNDYTLIIWLENEETDIVVFYVPMLGTANYAFVDHLGSDTLTEVMLEDVFGEYKKNDVEDILDVVDMIGDAIED